jgi:2-isopropylmalate synthase
VHAVTEGIDALGEVTVRISPIDDPRTFGGYAAEPDIIVASMKAYMAALNRMLAALGYGDVKPEGGAATVGISGD